MKELNYQDLLNFFKKHNLYDKEIFNYIRANTRLMDFRDEDKRDDIGYFYSTTNNIIDEVNICVPMITDKKTLLINIYIYTYAILLTKQIGKRQKKQNIESAIALLFEKIYIDENPNKQLEEYLQKLDANTKISSNKEHKIALEVRPILVEYYNKHNPTLNKLQKKAKRLTRRIQSK